MFHRVLVAGVGALGSEIVKNLGLLGCESVFLADPDILEEKNIRRSLLMRGGFPGVSKVEHAISRLKDWFPNTKWLGAPVEITDVGAEHFLQSDAIFSCVDTDLARVEIAVLAAHYQLPVCDGGLGGTSTRVGRVSWFPADRSEACFSCLLAARRRAEIFSLWESDVHSCWADDEQKQQMWTSTPTMASIVAGVQVEAAISAARNSFSMQLDFDSESVFQKIQHNRSAECPLHSRIEGIPFPVCTLAECKTCGQQFAPNRRIAWLRRRGTCPSCGDNDLVIRASTREEMIRSPS